MTLWSLLCFILFNNLASKTVMIIMKLIVIVFIYCLQRYIFQQTGLTLITCFVKEMVRKFTVVRLNQVNNILRCSRKDVMLRHYRNKHGMTSLKKRDAVPQTEGHTPPPPPLTQGYSPPQQQQPCTLPQSSSSSSQ